MRLEKTEVLGARARADNTPLRLETWSSDLLFTSLPFALRSFRISPRHYSATLVDAAGVNLRC